MQMFPKIDNGRKSHKSDLTSQFNQLNPFSGLIRVIFNFGISFRSYTLRRNARSSKFQPKSNNDRSRRLWNTIFPNLPLSWNKSVGPPSVIRPKATTCHGSKICAGTNPLKNILGWNIFRKLKLQHCGTNAWIRSALLQTKLHHPKTFDIIISILNFTSTRLQCQPLDKQG